MNTKLCTACKVELPLAQFNKKAGKLNTRCKSCLSDYYRKAYEQNPIRRKQVYEAVRRRKRKIKAFVDELKSKPCMDCGCSYPPYVMDYDHRDSSEKSIVICRDVQRGYSYKRLLEEITKCDLVCSNCHRIRTHNRL